MANSLGKSLKKGRKWNVIQRKDLHLNLAKVNSIKHLDAIANAVYNYGKGTYEKLDAELFTFDLNKLTKCTLNKVDVIAKDALKDPANTPGAGKCIINMLPTQEVGEKGMDSGIEDEAVELLTEDQALLVAAQLEENIEKLKAAKASLAEAMLECGEILEEEEEITVKMKRNLKLN